MQAHLGTIVCKFGDDRVMFVVEEAICAKFTDRQTDRRTTDASRLHKLILWNELKTSLGMLEEKAFENFHKTWTNKAEQKTCKTNNNNSQSDWLYASVATKKKAVGAKHFLLTKRCSISHYVKIRDGSFRINLPSFEDDVQFLISHLSTTWFYCILFYFIFLFTFIV